MQLDFSALTPAERYRWLTSTVTPRPIAWVSTRSHEGVSNLAPFSFFQVISSDPPTLLINVGLILGLLQFVTTFGITAWYVSYSNRKLDPIAAEIRNEIEGHEFDKSGSLTRGGAQ